ncbi:phosphatidate cytidylyltransferase [Pragia fontium]|uniref:Phosphatidate cytidylyltransferase n=1 Tax=Pragia fontium TaxID=82985 RepID=A0ABQ5LFG2_9GAMM|nr:phosphatidate cytidylyltransferase [Pragia fontium]AKJ41850.1 phosphatidate cytidylyltransferase [Pragia fontium]GKX62129.1 phosphatidate cytidylyltransferase [Pragia fontium]SUB82072.1 Phosphatidate cytidylyltransferase [Pragia fontium]VEJ54700.1 Phosphatidate cytidylyltransferase [Pragia fontium]
MSPILIRALVIMFTLLIVASITIRVLSLRSPDKDWTELRQRITTWWWIVIVFALAISTPRAISLTIFAIISFLALKEYLTLIPTRRSDHMPLLWAYIAIPIQYYFIGIEWYSMFLVFIPVYVFLFLPMRMVLIGDNKSFLHSAAMLHWGVMTTVFAISHVAYLTVLPDSAPETGPLLVIFLVVLTECNDIAQYLWGKSFGRIKVIPKVSPNKTLEGLLGGVATTMFLAWLLGGILTPLNGWESILVGLLIGVAGFIGDVVMSAVKRDIGVKDSGKLLPGHGGILDRLDSLIYTAPLFFHVLYYLHY